jgi:putative transposase
LGPAKWTYFYLYVVLDIFSRYVVGWMIAGRETAILAQRVIHEAIEKQNIVSFRQACIAERNLPGVRLGGKRSPVLPVVAP